MLTLISLVILTTWWGAFSSKIGMHLILIVMDLLGAFGIGLLFLLTVGWSVRILIGAIS